MLSPSYFDGTGTRFLVYKVDHYDEDARTVLVTNSEAAAYACARRLYLTETRSDADMIAVDAHVGIFDGCRLVYQSPQDD